MEDTTEYTTDDSYGTSSFTDPISSLFGGFFFIIILILVIILVAMMMLGSGVGWLAKTVTGGAKEKFEMPKLGPRPCAEHDERCADFPAL